MKEWITIPQAAEMMGVHRSTAWRRLKKLDDEKGGVLLMGRFVRAGRVAELIRTAETSAEVADLRERVLQLEIEKDERECLEELQNVASGRGKRGTYK